MKSIKAFQEAYMSADILDSENFNDFEVRKMRYKIYWAFYENTSYSNIHKWAQGYRADNGLYKYIRNIYNPAYRLAEFWRSHLWGGRIDPLCGDGKAVPSSLPVITENDNLRPVIAQIFRDSNWMIKKDIFTLWGSIFGDCALAVEDDPEKEKVYIKIIHPGIIRNVKLDDFGNVKEYAIEETRKDNNRDVVYLETATREGESVVYQTFKDGKPYAWGDQDQTWYMPYGFTPLIVQKHNDVGLDWGWSEFHAGRSKFHEVDDLASKLSDQIRKTVHSAWFFTGMDKPKNKMELSTPSTSSDERDKRQAGREDIPSLYGPQGSTANPLVANLQISDSSNYIATILKAIEQDYPELALDIHNIQGDISGRALRMNQQPANDKVNMRRVTYDDALTRAVKMAISIGAMKGYPGFEGFSINSYKAGELDFSIGERPVFKRDPLDDIEIDKGFWDEVNAAKNTGVPVPVYLKRKGWSVEDINEIINSEEYKSRMAVLEQSRKIGENTRPVMDKKGTNEKK